LTEFERGLFDTKVNQLMSLFNLIGLEYEQDLVALFKVRSKLS